MRSVIDYAARLFERSPPVLEEQAGEAPEETIVNNNLRKVQIGNRGGGKTHFRAPL